MMAALSGPARAEVLGEPRFDDVFGDAVALRRSVDRSLELGGEMRRISDDFARSVQEVLGGLGSKAPCAQLMPAYGRALRLGQDYLKVGRELSRHHGLVKEADKLGLTTDYRVKADQVVQGYRGLLTDYREMKIAFHDQLTDELRFAGCDREARSAAVIDPAAGEGPALARAEGAEPGKAHEADKEAEKGARKAEERPAIIFYVDNSRCRREHHVFLDGQRIGDVSGGQRGVFHSTAGPHELCLLSQDAAPPQLAAPADKPAAPAFSSLGDPLEALGAVGLRAAHASPRGGCGSPGTVRRSYLHDGWTIALRCE